MRGTFVCLTVVLALAPLSWGQAINKQTLDQIKDSSVFIKMKIPNVGEASGSGFVIRTTGDTVLIMTNRHVVVPDEEDLPAGAKHELWVVFRSGTPQQQELPATLLAYDDREVRDLAVLEVKGVQAPPRGWSGVKGGAAPAAAAPRKSPARRGRLLRDDARVHAGLPRRPGGRRRGGQHQEHPRHHRQLDVDQQLPPRRGQPAGAGPA